MVDLSFIQEAIFEHPAEESMTTGSEESMFSRIWLCFDSKKEKL